MNRWAPPVVAGVAAIDLLARHSTVTPAGRRVTLFDDAMISMRYARNLVEGHGLVWNPGGGRSQGYTNLLWTLWMAICQEVPHPQRWAPAVVAVTAVGAAVATVVVVGRLGEHLDPDGRAAAAARWASALCLPLIGWAVLGMEVAPLALLLAGAALAAARWSETQAVRDLAVTGLLGGAAVLVRTDAALPAGVVAAWCWWRARPGRRWTALAVAGGAIVAALAATTVFSLAYYRHPVPNTYYLKLGGIPLAVRLHRGVADLGWAALTVLGVPTVLAGLALATRPLRDRPLAWLLSAMAAVQLAYGAYVGGDSYDGGDAGGRFVAVALPLVLVVAAAAATTLADRRIPAWATAGGLAVAGLLVILAAAGARPGQRYQIGPYAVHGTAVRVAAPVLLLVALAVAAARRRTAPRPARALTAGLAIVALVAGGGGTATAEALRGPSLASSFDSQMMRVAMAIRAATDPGAVIGTSAVGQIGYYSDRRVVDLLGYTDPVIADRRPASGPFVPGHDKYDVAYSVGRLRPDLLVDLWHAPTPGDVATLRTYGYQELLPELWIRGDSTHVRRSALSEVESLLA